MVAKSQFEFFDNKKRSNKAPTLTVDKYGRIYFNEAARELLGVKNVKAELYIGYDKANKRIGVTRPHLVKEVDLNPVILNEARNEVGARSFLNYYGINYSKTHHYIYVGKYNNVFMFEHEDLAGVNPNEKLEITQDYD